MCACSVTCDALLLNAGDCGDPGAPTNGHKFETGSMEGDTVYYICDSEFKLSSNVTRTCQSNGEWSGTQPKCNCTFSVAL